MMVVAAAKAFDMRTLGHPVARTWRWEHPIRSSVAMHPRLVADIKAACLQYFPSRSEFMRTAFLFYTFETHQQRINKNESVQRMRNVTVSFVTCQDVLDEFDKMGGNRSALMRDAARELLKKIRELKT